MSTFKLIIIFFNIYGILKIHIAAEWKRGSSCCPEKVSTQTEMFSITTDVYWCTYQKRQLRES